MELLAVLIIAALVFGVCFLVDKGFAKLFRSQAQHFSGLSVRLNKKYGSIGLIVVVIGIAALFAQDAGWLLVGGGVLLILVGVCLVAYYMTFGLFYDQDTFVLTTFGKRSETYYYRDITAQQLYQSYGTVIVELFMKDGRSVQLQSGMDGMYPFMDHAFSAWLRQMGKNREDCSFYDPENSCWFPPVEGK